MNQCIVNGESKDLELLYSIKHIMDVKKVDKSSDLFAIKTFDAELDKDAPITVENGVIKTINISNKGKYYSEEPPNIIIEPPASSNGKQAKATAIMDIKMESPNNYWEIKNITVNDGGTGYDAIADIDKIKIEKKIRLKKKLYITKVNLNIIYWKKKNRNVII